MNIQISFCSGIESSLILPTVKRLSLHASQVAHQGSAYLRFCSMKRLQQQQQQQQHTLLPK